VNLQNRIHYLTELGKNIAQNPPLWQEAKIIAEQKNPWFTQTFINQATQAILDAFLNEALLTSWASRYPIPTDEPKSPKNIGIVMAGNIPMVGFHDLLSVFISGHTSTIKLSSKDDVLIPFLVKTMQHLFPDTIPFISFADQLKGCDAYIATGGNQAATYFEQYFSKYPSIIRKNKTSVAVLTGKESDETLLKLADDVHLYFGLGCRSITQIYVPKDFDFVRLIKAFNAYDYFIEHHRYKNNYDYQLSLFLLNSQPYMSSEATLMIENANPFSALGVLHYQVYDDISVLEEKLANIEQLQCIVGEHFVPFGQSQSPKLEDYADGIDTLSFLTQLYASKA
jgi:hypothetical protein